MTVNHLSTRHISDHRLAPYKKEVFDSTEKALELYRLDRTFSAALFNDISYIEVALRNSLDAALTKSFGPEWWCSQIGFDSRVQNHFAEAWDRLPSRFTRNVTSRGERLKGRVIASCMFGTWSDMLDSGVSTGLPAPFDRARHNEIWSKATLLDAFPGAQTELAAADLAYFQQNGLDRSWVHVQVRMVKEIRNRIAHHESLFNGVPIPGTDPIERMDAQECIDQCKRLSRMIDRELALFLEEDSSSQDRLEEINNLLER